MTAREVVYVNPGEAAFLNVDVDVRSRSPLEALVARLGPSVLINHVGAEGRGRHGAHFSLYHPKSADHAIRRLAKLIGQLPTSARRLWNGAQKRVFNIGFDGGLYPRQLEAAISTSAIQAVARLGASITVTIYAVDQESLKHQAAQQVDAADECPASDGGARS